MKNKIIIFMVAALFSLPLEIGLSNLLITAYAQGSPVFFTQTLQLGSTGEEVSGLQTFLRKFPSIYPEGWVTGYFGLLTENAVKRFQKEVNIDAVGIVGPVTRAKLNELSQKALPVAGFIGTTSTTGATGATGAVGATGITGTTGATGAAGTTGTTGATGVTGATGEAGLRGGSGSAGSTGATGNTGATGEVGASGATGSAGAAGAVGATGITGTTGATGATGAVGVAGITGATGAAGAPGTIVPAGIELGTLDAFSRYQILNKMSSSILRLGSWQSDGDATSNISEGIVVYGNSLTGQTLSPGAGSYARIKNNRFGLFTIDNAASGFTGAGGYYYRVDDSALFYKNNAGADTFRVTRATGDTTVKGTVTLSNFTQPGVIGTNSSGLLANITGTTGQVPVWDNSANGFSWAAMPAGTIPSAQYAQLGSQPGTIAPGQAFTYSTTILSTTGITPVTTAPPGGTVFTLANAGRYEVNYQMTYPTDGGVVLYLGATIPTMSPLPYTMIGKTPDGAVNGSVIIETTSSNSFLSVNAAAGNAVAIAIPPNSSSSNQSATTVSIKQIQ